MSKIHHCESCRVLPDIVDAHPAFQADSCQVEQFNSILFISFHTEQYNVLCFFKLSMSSINCCHQQSDCFKFIQFNSILYLISHRAIQYLLIFKLSISLINCMYNLFVFSHTIHDIFFIICVSCGNREGISLASRTTVNIFNPKSAPRVEKKSANFHPMVR